MPSISNPSSMLALLEPGQLVAVYFTPEDGVNPVCSPHVSSQLHVALSMNFAMPSQVVIPAKAGIHLISGWIPGCAYGAPGMTEGREPCPFPHVTERIQCNPW